MQFIIANTFTESLARLTGDEQKAAKTTVFDLQTDPSQPGTQFPPGQEFKGPELLVRSRE